MQKPKETSERVFKYLTSDGMVRGASVVATDVVDEMRKVLGSYPLATMAVGRAMVGSILMASHLKQGHSVGVYFRGNGPLSSLYAESTFEGKVRAYTPNPLVEVPLKEGKLDVSRGIGIGLLQVVRGTPYQKQFHTGTVEIRTGEIGDDIAYYLEQSHQIYSIVALGLHLDTYGHVKAAGGVLIELMPGATPVVIDSLEKRAKEVTSISHMIQNGANSMDLIQAFLKDFDVEEIPHDYPLSYECRCSKERVERSLILIGHAELDQMIEDGEPAHVTCDFCGRKYEISHEDLQKLRQISFKKSLN